MERALNCCTQSASVALEESSHCPFPDVNCTSYKPMTEILSLKAESMHSANFIFKENKHEYIEKLLYSH